MTTRVHFIILPPPPNTRKIAYTASQLLLISVLHDEALVLSIDDNNTVVLNRCFNGNQIYRFFFLSMCDVEVMLKAAFFSLSLSRCLFPCLFIVLLFSYLFFALKIILQYITRLVTPRGT